MTPTRDDAPGGASSVAVEVPEAQAPPVRGGGPLADPWRPSHRERVIGWATAAAVTAVAAVLRLPALDRPHRFVFDETYYVKDAWTLLHLGYEGTWPEGADAAFETGDVDGYGSTAARVVHPPVGKLLIAVGLRAFGAQDAVGWRISAAVAGIVAVLVLTRTARRLFRSTAWGAVAGLLLAVDGAAIVHSRTALLDGFLMVLLLGAFAALVVDRDRARERLHTLTAAPRAPGVPAVSGWRASLGPSLGLRPWRLLAGVLLGLALGTKWSALVFVAAFGLLSVGWDASARLRAGVPQWWAGTVLRDAPAAFVSLVGVAAVTYTASWTTWFRSSGGYHRQWAAQHPGEGLTWLPETLRSWVDYHRETWEFHTTLTSEHPYAAHPAGWLLQLRPTSFFYTSPTPPQQWCGAEACSQAVTSLGNPLVWWLGTVALVVCLWRVLRHRDGVAVACLVGVAAGWLPWLTYAHRTIFAFYAIALLPWLVLSLTYAARLLWDWAGPRGGTGRSVRVALAVTGLAVLTLTVFFLPVWTGEVITLRSWQTRMWFRGWV